MKELKRLRKSDIKLKIRNLNLLNNCVMSFYVNMTTQFYFKFVSLVERNRVWVNKRTLILYAFIGVQISNYVLLTPATYYKSV